MALCGGVLLRDSLENPRESLISFFILINPLPMHQDKTILRLRSEDDVTLSGVEVLSTFKFSY
jgi:hypothetical protein